MPANKYKIFFTLSFVYQVDTKKKVSKSFKSDIDINADNVKNLKLQWSFGISSQDVRAQPIVIGEVILLSDSDSLHALNRENGCPYWKFSSKARRSNAPVLNIIDGDSNVLVDSGS